MGNEKKLVSVIIPTYRRPETLESALVSVLASTYEPFEIIVVDDNEEDDFHQRTKALTDRMREKHGEIRYVRMPAHGGGSAARNTGFRASRGEYIMLLDDDDRFLPEKMAAQAAFLDGCDESWGVCYTRYVDMRNGKVIGRSGETRQGALLVEELARNLFIHAGSNLMLRRGVVEEVGGFDESFERNQDIEFLIRTLKRRKLGFVDVEGLIVSIHARPGVDDIRVTEFFLQKFQAEIDALPEKDRSAVRKMLALQMARAALQEHHDAPLALRMLRKEGVSLREALGYLLHLIRRKHRRVSCGYDLNRLRRT